MPRELGDFHSGWWEHELSQGLWIEDCSLQFFCVGFPQPQVVSRMHALVSTQVRLQRELCRSLKPFSLGSPFSQCSTLGLHVCGYLAFTGLPAFFPLEETATPYLGFSSWTAALKLFPDSQLGHGRAHWICFPSIGNHCPMPTNVQCL